MGPPGPGAGPTMQLKRINWERLPGVGIENTVWGQVGSISQVKIFNTILQRKVGGIISTDKFSEKSDIEIDDIVCKCLTGLFNIYLCTHELKREIAHFIIKLAGVFYEQILIA